MLRLVLNHIVKGLKSQLCRRINGNFTERPEVCTQEFDVITSNEKTAKVSVYLCPPYLLFSVMYSGLELTGKVVTVKNSLLRNKFFHIKLTSFL